MQWNNEHPINNQYPTKSTSNEQSTSNVYKSLNHFEKSKMIHDLRIHIIREYHLELFFFLGRRGVFIIEVARY